MTAIAIPKGTCKFGKFPYFDILTVNYGKLSLEIALCLSVSRKKGRFHLVVFYGAQGTSKLSTSRPYTFCDDKFGDVSQFCILMPKVKRSKTVKYFKV